MDIIFTAPWTADNNANCWQQHIWLWLIDVGTTQAKSDVTIWYPWLQKSGEIGKCIKKNDRKSRVEKVYTHKASDTRALLEP